MAHYQTFSLYPIDGTDYDITFEFLARRFVTVTAINAQGDETPLVVNQDYRYLSNTTIRLFNIQPGWSVLRLLRRTSATDRIVDFKNGSVLRDRDLNISQIQSIHIAEEARDQSVELTLDYTRQAKEAADRAKVSETNAHSSEVSAAGSAAEAKVSLNRALRVPASEVYLNDLPVREQRKNKLIAFDSVGDATVLIPEPGTAAAVMVGLVQPDGFRNIGIVADQIALEDIEPRRPDETVLVYGHLMGNHKEVLKYRSPIAGETVRPHDGGMVVATKGGKRWYLCTPSGAMQMSWWKNPRRTWDEAVAGWLLWTNTQGTAIPKIAFPRGTHVFKRNIVLNNTKDYHIVGQRGNSSGTTLQFQIPRSAGLMNNACIEHWASEFKFNCLQLNDIVIEGLGTPKEGTDDASFGMVHGVKCRTTGALWSDVKIQNFRGAGLWLDNAFDNTFNKVGVFACGRMKDGYDYMNVDHVGSREACLYPPIWIMSSRSGDASNFNRFLDQSFELNNCTPFCQIGGIIEGNGHGKGGIQHHFIRTHSERPGRASMPVAQRGTFLFISNGEVWLDSVGVSNFVNLIEYGPYVQLFINNSGRASGDIVNMSTSNGNCRFRITNSIIGGSLTIPSNIQHDTYITGTIINGAVRTATTSGMTAVSNSRINGDVEVGGVSLLGSMGGFKMDNCMVTGNVTGTDKSNRVNVTNCYINGDLKLLGNHSFQAFNQVTGTTEMAKMATNHGIGTEASPAVLWVDNSYSEIDGTVTKGTHILRRNNAKGNAPGWVALTTGSNGGGLTVAAMGALQS